MPRDPDKMSHAELHALTVREINKRLDDEARQRREAEQRELDRRGGKA